MYMSPNATEPAQQDLVDQLTTGTSNDLHKRELCMSCLKAIETVDLGTGIPSRELLRYGECQEEKYESMIIHTLDK